MFTTENYPHSGQKFNRKEIFFYESFNPIKFSENLGFPENKRRPCGIAFYKKNSSYFHEKNAKLP